MVTADHVGQGRFGLNIVAGWNEDEFEMFGVAQRDHDGRYAYAQEWIDAIRAAWERDDFDVDGTYLHLKGVREKPKPFGGSRPIIMNAGQSPDGRAFAIRNSDAFFTIARLSTDLAPMIEEVRTVKAAAAALGREIDVFKTAFVTCRPTRAEAVEYHRYCVEENADWDAIETLMEGRGLMKLAEDERKLIRANYPKAVLGYALVGNPDDVARGLADVAAAGLAGIALAFVNYGAELPYVCAEVLPRLERMGLRS
jgi:alkanesulfonate monooxygenase SsuD/methylene tetrahydromethanopterin reductase-like flavin-dependent oxidoreductase (luciferase family)